MSWPTVAVNTTNLDATGDVPANARADLLDLVQKVNSMIAIEPVGRLINIQIFTASGTYTPTTGTKSVVVEAVGGGGGGCGAAVPGASTSVIITTAGGSAAYGKARFTSGFSGVSVTVGAAGSGGAGVFGSSAAGSDGGNTSFGSLLVCPGGKGGAYASNGWSWGYITVGSRSMAYGGLQVFPTSSPTGANIAGFVCDLPISGYVFNDVGYSASRRSIGGSTPLGVASDVGGSGYGYGGSGSIGVYGGSAEAGKNGGAGVVIVYEYS